MISQRQIGIDTASYAEALRQVLRQTPDVILIGELRDLDTLNVSLQAAETGHLVFATMHTSSAAETIDRISNMYPPHERNVLWTRLAATLRGVVSQRLAKRADGAGRVVAQEIMVVTPSIGKMIEECRPADLYNAIRQDGIEGYYGMITMNQSLECCVAAGAITEDEALSHAGNPTELRQKLRRRLHPEEPEAEPEAPSGFEMRMAQPPLPFSPPRPVPANRVPEPETPAEDEESRIGLAAGVTLPRQVRIPTPPPAGNEDPFVLRRR
jgi:twitching motility protein PilT